MPGAVPEPQHTALILLGAQDFPLLFENEGASTPSLARSSQMFREYLCRHSDNLGIEPAFVLDLFDSTLRPSEQIDAIEELLRSFVKATPKSKRRNIIVHYAGHGVVPDGEPDFYLATRCTRARSTANTSIHPLLLAKTFETNAPIARKIIFIDCCFAGAAVRSFLGFNLTGYIGVRLSDAFSAISRTMFGVEGSGSRSQRNWAGGLLSFLVRAAPIYSEPEPSRGTSLLCAASQDDFATSEFHNGATQFTGAIMEALEEVPRDITLRLQDVGNIAYRQILEHNVRRIRPCMYSPVQSEGDVGQIPLFPGLAASSAHSVHEDRTSRPTTSKRPWVVWIKKRFELASFQQTRKQKTSNLTHPKPVLILVGTFALLALIIALASPWWKHLLPPQEETLTKPSPGTEESSPEQKPADAQVITAEAAFQRFLQKKQIVDVIYKWAYPISVIREGAQYFGFAVSIERGQTYCRWAVMYPQSNAKGVARIMDFDFFENESAEPKRVVQAKVSQLYTGNYPVYLLRSSLGPCNPAPQDRRNEPLEGKEVIALNPGANKPNFYSSSRGIVSYQQVVGAVVVKFPRAEINGSSIAVLDGKWLGPIKEIRNDGEYDFATIASLDSYPDFSFLDD